MSARYLKEAVPLLWESSRPRMYPLCFGIAVVPAALALRDGSFSMAVFALEALLVCMLDALACWADDCGDGAHGVDDASRRGPARPLQRGDLCVADLIAWCAILASACAAVGLALLALSLVRGGISMVEAFGFLTVGALCITAAFAYTIGERPYGYRALGDAVGFAFFGPVAVLAGCRLYGCPIDLPAVLAACGAGLFNVLAINLQNVRDLEGDKTHGKITVAVALGPQGARIYHVAVAAVAIAAFVSAAAFSGVRPVGVAALAAASVPLAVHAVCFWRETAVPHKGLDALTRQVTWGALALAVGFCVLLALA